MDIYDVIVVGLGPAGSTASYKLKKGGLQILALDRETFPRYKPCGGCLSKKIDSLLDFDFKGVVEHTVSGVVFTNKFKREVTIRSDEPVAYMVQRDRFDSLLVDKAKEAGVDIRDGEAVKDIHDRGGFLEVCTARCSYRGRYLIGADGPFSVVAKRFFPDVKREIGIAMEGEADADAGQLKSLKGMVSIDFGYIPAGYGWIFPKDGAVSVGVAGQKDKIDDIKKYFNGFLHGKGLEDLRFKRLKGWIIPVFSHNNSRVARNKVCLIGDAGGMVDPFLGEGISYAIESANILSREILKTWNKGLNPDDIQASIEKEMYGEFSSAKRVAEIIYKFPHIWYDLLYKNPSFMEIYMEVLRGSKNYGDFLKEIKQRLRSSRRLWLQVVISLIRSKIRRFFKSSSETSISSII